MEYRIIKKSMYSVTGLPSYRGYVDVYYIQYRGWFGKWRNIDNSLSVNYKQAEELLKLAEDGKLTTKGEVVC